jgi:glucose-1-phosphate thymidylyltransferase
VAWRQGWIDAAQLECLAQPLMKSGYGDYLLQMLQEDTGEHLLMQRNLDQRIGKETHAG